MDGPLIPRRTRLLLVLSLLLAVAGAVLVGLDDLSTRAWVGVVLLLGAACFGNGLLGELREVRRRRLADG